MTWIDVTCPYCELSFEYSISTLLDNAGESKGLFNRFTAWRTIKRMKKMGVILDCPQCKREFKYEGEANELLG